MEKRTFRIEEYCFFSREQLLEQDYDPIAQGDVDLEYLKEKYAGHVRLDHAAAVRGILVRDAGKIWKWVWGIGLLHDQILARTEYNRLYARYRNQRLMLPRIEFHNGADLWVALQLLLEQTPLEKSYVINIKSDMGGLWMSIGEYFGS